MSSPDNHVVPFLFWALNQLGSPNLLQLVILVSTLLPTPCHPQPVSHKVIANVKFFYQHRVYNHIYCNWHLQAAVRSKGEGWRGRVGREWCRARCLPGLLTGIFAGQIHSFLTCSHLAWLVEYLFGLLACRNMKSGLLGACVPSYDPLAWKTYKTYSPEDGATTLTTKGQVPVIKGSQVGGLEGEYLQSQVEAVHHDF